MVIIVSIVVYYIEIEIEIGIDSIFSSVYLFFIIRFDTVWYGTIPAHRFVSIYHY